MDLYLLFNVGCVVRGKDGIVYRYHVSFIISSSSSSCSFSWYTGRLLWVMKCNKWGNVWSWIRRDCIDVCNIGVALDLLYGCA